MQAEHSTAITEFAAIVRGFCDWCERSQSAQLTEESAASWMAKLHAGALALPETESPSDHDLLSPPAAATAQAQLNLAPFNGFYYREYFNPSPLLDNESVMGDVGDDLLDTYKDVRAGLVLYDAGQQVDALWYWSFLHRAHWGRHAVGAMFALQCARSFGDE